MEMGNEISHKIRSAIKAKLVDLGAYVDDELPDYIMVMVANKKSQQQMTDDLNLFLGDNTEKFTEWLHGLLNKLKSIVSDPKDEGSKPANRSADAAVEEPELTLRPEKDEFDEEPLAAVDVRQQDVASVCSATSSRAGVGRKLRRPASADAEPASTDSMTLRDIDTSIRASLYCLENDSPEQAREEIVNLHMRLRNAVIAYEERVAEAEEEVASMRARLLEESQTAWKEKLVTVKQKKSHKQSKMKGKKRKSTPVKPRARSPAKSHARSSHRSSSEGSSEETETEPASDSHSESRSRRSRSSSRSHSRSRSKDKRRRRRHRSQESGEMSETLSLSGSERGYSEKRRHSDRQGHSSRDRLRYSEDYYHEYDNRPPYDPYHPGPLYDGAQFNPGFNPYYQGRPRGWIDRGRGRGWVDRSRPRGWVDRGRGRGWVDRGRPRGWIDRGRGRGPRGYPHDGHRYEGYNYNNREERYEQDKSGSRERRRSHSPEGHSSERHNSHSHEDRVNERGHSRDDHSGDHRRSGSRENNVDETHPSNSNESVSHERHRSHSSNEDTKNIKSVSSCIKRPRSSSPTTKRGPDNYRRSRSHSLDRKSRQPVKHSREESRHDGNHQSYGNHGRYRQQSESEGHRRPSRAMELATRKSYMDIEGKIRDTGPRGELARGRGRAQKPIINKSREERPVSRDAKMRENRPNNDRNRKAGSHSQAQDSEARRVGREASGRRRDENSDRGRNDCEADELDSGDEVGFVMSEGEGDSVVKSPSKCDWMEECDNLEIKVDNRNKHSDSGKEMGRDNEQTIQGKAGVGKSKRKRLNDENKSNTDNALEERKVHIQDTNVAMDEENVPDPDKHGESRPSSSHHVEKESSFAKGDRVKSSKKPHKSKKTKKVKGRPALNDSSDNIEEAALRERAMKSMNKNLKDDDQTIHKRSIEFSSNRAPSEAHASDGNDDVDGHDERVASSLDEPVPVPRKRKKIIRPHLENVA